MRAGKVPAQTTIVPTYDTPDQRLVISIVYPTIPTAEPQMMNGALRFVLSAITAVVMVATKATKWGGGGGSRAIELVLHCSPIPL